MLPDKAGGDSRRLVLSKDHGSTGSWAFGFATSGGGVNFPDYQREQFFGHGDYDNGLWHQHMNSVVRQEAEQKECRDSRGCVSTGRSAIF